MRSLLILASITVCYAAYNLLVKVSTSHVASVSTPPILATLFLQSTALVVSLIYLLFLTRQNVSLALPVRAYSWAAAAGLCIGVAEILYFYLFRGIDNQPPIAASTAIPFIVGGTILIAVAVSHFVFKEHLNFGQWIGVGLAFIGILVLAFSSN
jgi:uncharacterized membrane protein